MNELKLEDVMKALQLHADCETDNCFECPYENYLSKADGNCVHHLSMDALALLREKDAKIADYVQQIADMQKEIAQQADLITFHEQHKAIEADKDAEIDRLKNVTEDLRRQIRKLAEDYHKRGKELARFEVKERLHLAPCDAFSDVMEKELRTVEDASPYKGEGGEAPDPVAHPAHYTYGKIEVIDFIQDKDLNFALGNAVKYIVRAGRKAEQGMTDEEKAIQDLEKARQYIDFEIEHRKGVRG